MSDNCNIEHPLKREGTYQWQRLADGLKEGYFKPDDRSIETIVKQIAEYASLVRYYNEDLSEWGNWEAFFEYLYDYRTHKLKVDNIDTLLADGRVPPHLGLMLSFLKTFEPVRSEFNNLTERHLDFYYNDVLQLAANGAVADKVAIVFVPEKNTVQAKVEKGRALNGGKDATKKDLIYKTTKEIVVNQGIVAKKKSMYADKAGGSISGLYISKDAAVDNAIIQNNITSWLPFGSKANNLADIGFAVSSPMLLAAEGRRRLSIEFEGVGGVARDAFKAIYTGPKGWVEAPVDLMPGINNNSSSESQKYLLIKIDASFPAIVAYDEKLHESNLNCSYPVVKILLKNDAGFAKGFNFLSSVRKSGLKKMVMNVDGVRSFSIVNDLGKLNPLKAFQPFGSAPVKHKSSFILGHPQAFNKYLSTFHLAMNWKGAPGNMFSHYKPYDDYLIAYGLKPTVGSAVVKKENDPYTGFRQPMLSFNQGNVPGKLELLKGGKWVQIVEDEGSNYNARTPETKDRMNVFHAENLTADAFDLSQSNEYQSDSKYGFIKVTLGYDFGHNIYAAVLTDTVLYNAKQPSAATLKPSPAAPYTPEFNSLELEYVLESSLGSQYPEHQFIQLHPFGNKIITKESDGLISADYNYNGQLYIGLDQFKTSQIVNFYIARLDGSEDVNALINETIRIYYLSGDVWKEFSFDMIVTDTTVGFTSSGFLSLNIPEDALIPNTIMGESLVWIRFASLTSATSYPNVIDIFTNAVEAVFEDNGNDPNHLQSPLPAGTIAKSMLKIDGVKSLQQPFSSYGGSMQEQKEQFYTRISERLRHKGRAWSMWDYERLILDRFSSIYKIKCISHSVKNDMYAPGNVLCVVIPNLENVSDKDLLQPRISQGLLQSVKNYISPFMTAFANLEVINPVYETVTIKCSVKIRKGYDETYYARQLNTDLQQYISPWIMNRNVSPSFGGKLYASALINFMEEREYIDYITFFSATKLGVNGLETWTEYTVGSSEDMILTSAGQHQIDTNAIC
jgi:hypothetical protein